MRTDEYQYMKKNNRLKHIFKWVAITAGVLLLLLYIGLPAGMGIYTLTPARSEVGSPPPGFEEVSLQTEDGVQLQGWYRTPLNGELHSGAAIILLHGASGSRESVRSYAEMLAGEGYGVLALDLRGHGESSGKTNRLGWQGTQDVGAAVEFLQGRPEVSAIGGLGISMGGEALLGAADRYPQIRAIAADGATRRTTTELLALESERSLVRNFTARVFFAAVRLFGGEPAPGPLLDAMVASGDTQFLLIAAGNNEQETAFNRVFAQTLGSRASLWVAPNASHTAAFSMYPEEYKGRLLAFFDAALKGGGAR
jgi:pimeloyl-ACP methyl ester carboxylesterase